jgi:hypothetical protein
MVVDMTRQALCLRDKLRRTYFDYEVRLSEIVRLIHRVVKKALNDSILKKIPRTKIPRYHDSPDSHTSSTAEFGLNLDVTMGI